jgi:hypothetical protein
MKFKVSVLITLVTLAYFGYIFFMGIFHPDSLGYTELMVLCALMGIASYYITMGAFSDIDQERAGK